MVAIWNDVHSQVAMQLQRGGCVRCAGQKKGKLNDMGLFTSFCGRNYFGFFGGLFFFKG